jgi:molecular chaperone GrpE
VSKQKSEEANPSQETSPEQEHMQDQTSGQANGTDEVTGGEHEAADDLAGVRDELDGHRERVRELEDQLLRRAAEFQNYRRRTQQDLGQVAERGRAEVITRLLDVLDDLRRSREAAEQAAADQNGGPLYDALKEGVDLVYRKFEDTLASFGVKAIDAVGHPFDEQYHEALMQKEAPDAESGTVVAEIQKGYVMSGRVLRHARVIVAR